MDQGHLCAIKRTYACLVGYHFITDSKIIISTAISKKI